MSSFRKAIFLIIFSCITTGAIASDNSWPLSQYNSLAKIPTILDNQAVISSLKSVLGKDYSEFSQSFDVFGEPHKTKKGGLFAEGWLKDLYLVQASAFVIQPDGEIYAAWLSPENNEVRYATNAPEKSSMQEDIARWAQRFDKMMSSACKNPQKKHSMKSRYFETTHFRIKITPLIMSDSDCNDVSYEGVRKSDGAIVRLRGESIESDCGKLSCPVLTYMFRNHDASYLINNVINTLSVIVHGKILVSETGQWNDVSG